MRVPAVVLLVSAAGFVASTATAQVGTFVMGVDSGANAAHLFDPATGALVQQNWIEWGDLTDGGSATGSTAKHAIQVGTDIWVSDQLRDVIYRFDQAGNHLGNIPNAGIDNIKGMAVVGNQVWLTNAGTNQGAPGNSIVFIDIASATPVGSAPTVGSLFDLIHYQGQLLGSNITNQNLEFYDPGTGALTGTFHVPSPGGLQFPQQMFERENGNLLVAGFSTVGGSTTGIYEFTSEGVFLGIVAGNNARGVLELESGEVMWSNAGGFWVEGDLILGGTGIAGQYLSFVTVIPTPAGFTLFAAAGFAAARRRR